MKSKNLIPKQRRKSYWVPKKGPVTHKLVYNSFDYKMDQWILMCYHEDYAWELDTSSGKFFKIKINQRVNNSSEYPKNLI